MFPWLSSLLSRVFIDRRDGHRRAVLAALGEKKRVARLSREEQECYRDEKLAALLNHARERVPFWREKMEGVGEITAGNAREALKKLPEMGRAMIQEGRERFVDERVAGGAVAGSRLKVEGEEGAETRDLRLEAGANVQRSTLNSQLSSGGPSDSSSESKSITNDLDLPATCNLQPATPSNVQRSTLNSQRSSGGPSDSSSESESITDSLDLPATCNLQPATPSNVQRSTLNAQRSSGVPSDSSSHSKIQNPKSKMGVVEDATGGSSGTPMRFLVDRATQIARESSLYWADSLAGWKYGERVAMLWGSDKDVKSAGQALRARVRLWMDNRRWFNAFNMGEERMADFHAAMTRFRPHVMVAYAGSLEVYARYLTEKVAGCRLQVAGEEGVPSSPYGLRRTSRCSVFGVRGEEARGEAGSRGETFGNYETSEIRERDDKVFKGEVEGRAESWVKSFLNRRGHRGRRSGGEEGGGLENGFIIQHSSDKECGVDASSRNPNTEHRDPHSQSKIQNPKSKIPNYPLTALVSSAEVLTPQAREVIESVFGKRVFDRYGNREFGAIAAEDGKGGLVVNPTDVVLEVNEKGELLVTYLHNFAMPFIRYNTGDLVKFREDGRLQPVTGRSADTIRTATGKLIHGEFFTHLMYRAKEVREFQFVQETMSRYVLLLVAGRRESEDVMAGIRRDILEEIGEEAELEVRYVEEIPVLGSGKRKFTVSRVAGCRLQVAG